MKNFILLITGLIFATSCTNDLEDDYFDVKLAYETVVSEDAIVAYDGWSGKYGQILTFEALDVEGYTFVGWKKPQNYCMTYPIVDSENPRILYVDNPEGNGGNCNASYLNFIIIYPAYVRVN